MKLHDYGTRIPGVRYQRVYAQRWQLFFREEYVGQIKRAPGRALFWVQRVDDERWRGPYVSKDRAASVACFPGGSRG